MGEDLKNKAIKSALSQDWEPAIEYNLEYLDEFPNNIPALNRLAKAYFHTGNLKKAQETYKKVLSLDKYNPVASKQIQKLSNGCKNRRSKTIKSKFVEEPGKTKKVELLRVADKNILHELDSGELLDLKVKKGRLCVFSQDDQYIGALPDDISFHIRKLIETGNKYETILCSSSDRQVLVFIREILQSSKNTNHASFH
ncbi:tetratricopeptide repeat protein [Patescibacteria group bacterium]